jgi:hypothetical protein
MNTVINLRICYTQGFLENFRDIQLPDKYWPKVEALQIVRANLQEESFEGKHSEICKSLHFPTKLIKSFSKMSEAKSSLETLCIYFYILQRICQEGEGENKIKILTVLLSSTLRISSVTTLVMRFNKTRQC